MGVAGAAMLTAVPAGQGVGEQQHTNQRRDARGN